MFPEGGHLLSSQQSSTSSRLLYEGFPILISIHGDTYLSRKRSIYESISTILYPDRYVPMSDYADL